MCFWTREEVTSCEVTIILKVIFYRLEYNECIFGLDDSSVYSSKGTRFDLDSFGIESEGRERHLCKSSGF